MADCLSRNPELMFDREVNKEEDFEDNIFPVSDAGNLYGRIVAGQVQDDSEGFTRNRVRRPGR